MSELQPCPFCGGKAELEISRHENCQYDYAAVACVECAAKIRYAIDVKYSAADRCVDEWNARTDKLKEMGIEV